MYMCSQADTSPVIPPPLLLLVYVFPLPPSLPPSLSTEQGQLENIRCSFLAQPRHSLGPLIKHKPSPFLSLSSPLSPCTVTSLHLPHFLLLSLSHPPFLPATSFHHSTRAPSFLTTLARLLIPRPLCLFVMVEV